MSAGRQFCVTQFELLRHQLFYYGQFGLNNRPLFHPDVLIQEPFDGNRTWGVGCLEIWGKQWSSELGVRVKSRVAICHAHLKDYDVIKEGMTTCWEDSTHVLHDISSTQVIGYIGYNRLDCTRISVRILPVYRSDGNF